MPRKRPAKGNDDSKKRARITVPITLTNYWYETISREEALRRLASRNLDPDTHARIEKQIPLQTQHFCTFCGDAFREYADFGQGGAFLLIMLPMEKRDNKYLIHLPILGERRLDGRGRRISGIELDEFVFADGKLIENGLPRETFQHSTEPIKLQLDATFLEACGSRPSFCCDACEWVHSTLDIHGIDSWCCLGTCPGD